MLFPHTLNKFDIFCNTVVCGMGRDYCRGFFLFFFFLACFDSLVSVVLWGLGCSQCVLPVFHAEEVLARPQLGLSRLCEVKNDLLPRSPHPHFPLPRFPLPHPPSSISTRSRCFESCLQETLERGLSYFPQILSANTRTTHSHNLNFIEE